MINGDSDALDLRFDYRWGASLWVLRPWAGIEVTGNGVLYGVGGLLADFDLGPRWVFTPSAGAGLYDEGDGKDLGGPVEFRTQIEIARRFARDSRLAVALSHISNAGLYQDNPGTEILTLSYSFPLGRGPDRAADRSPP